MQLTIRGRWYRWWPGAVRQQALNTSSIFRWHITRFQWVMRAIRTDTENEVRMTSPMNDESLLGVWRNSLLQRRHNECDVISNHQCLDCLLNRLFRAAQRKHQRSVALAFVREIHRWALNSRHKGSVTRKKFPFDDVIMPAMGKMSKNHKNNRDLAGFEGNP